MKTETEDALLSEGDRYLSRTVVREDGERMVIVVDTCGVVAFAPTAYAMVRRPKSGSYNSLLAEMRGPVELHNHCALIGINLEECIDSGNFLSELEWRLFLARIGSGVKLATSERIADSSVRYIGWLARRTLKRMQDPSARADFSRLTRLNLIMMNEAIPAGGPSGQRDALTAEQLALLASILRDEDAMKCLWPRSFPRLRNAALINWQTLLGHRAGETLGLKCADFNLQDGVLTFGVVRRHDDPTDPRRLQPLVKGFGRRLSTPPAMREPLEAYLAVRRRLACTHGFLFVADVTDAPLSYSGLLKVYHRLGELHPSLRGMTPHTSRHTWVATFRRVVKQLGVSDVDASWLASEAMGWRDPGSDRLYAPGQRRETADALLLRMQAELLGEDDE